MTRSRGGQVMVESVLLVVLAVAALAVMGLTYLQRGLQGGTFSNAQALGTPFDPRDRSYFERSTSGISGETSDNTTYGRPLPMVEADLLEPQAWDGAEDPGMFLGDLPTGAVPREPAAYTEVQNTNRWNASSESRANVTY